MLDVGFITVLKKHHFHILNCCNYLFIVSSYFSFTTVCYLMSVCIFFFLSLEYLFLDVGFDQALRLDRNVKHLSEHVSHSLF